MPGIKLFYGNNYFNHNIGSDKKEYIFKYTWKRKSRSGNTKGACADDTCLSQIVQKIPLYIKNFMKYNTYQLKQRGRREDEG